jgi:hypothetical protein
MYMKTKVENMWGIVRRKCKLVQWTRFQHHVIKEYVGWR